ncbi:MAG: DUF3024 domain-containing protein [Opitutales bacterium]|nr:DUF3024 domain-containing protein [Opitutales bacterium]MCH8540580.1 DUF3024 domain-containing protein [Opitutales bacterium]
MALSEFEIERIKALVEEFLERRRPPLEIRDKLDLGYRIEGQSVVLFEVRSRYDNPKEKIEFAVAKATYVRKSNSWKIFWQRADLRWHGYEPHPEVDSLEKFLEVVDKDQYHCFWG